MDVTYRYVAGLSKLSGIPIEQLTRQRTPDSASGRWGAKKAEPFGRAPAVHIGTRPGRSNAP
jgi:hypothetical protein